MPDRPEQPDPGVQLVEPVDAFDLPDWLGTEHVTWTALSGVRGARLITGRLSGVPDQDPAHELDCDLLAADVATPRLALPEPWRVQAHRDWEHGEVLLLSVAGRLTLVVPGTAYSADGTLETISRLARALGVRSSRFRVDLQL